MSGNKTARHPLGDTIVFNNKWHSFKSIQQPRVKFISGTKLLKKFFGEFDSDAISKKYAEKNNMTQEEVLAMWNRKGDIGREMGTMVHNLLERRLLGKSATLDLLKHNDEEILEAARKKAAVGLEAVDWVLQNYDVIGIEEIVATHKYGVATIIDLRGTNKKTGQPAFLDWKTNAQIRMDNRWQSGLAPIQHLEDCDYIKYALQLNLFQKIAVMEGYIEDAPMIEKNIIHIGYDDFDVLPVPELQGEITQMLEAQIAKAA